MLFLLTVKNIRSSLIQLQLAIPYVNYTNSFFEIALEKYCGLSIYIPFPNEKNDFYDNLEWSKAINN